MLLCGESAAVVLVDLDSAVDLNELRDLCKEGRHRICLLTHSIATEFLLQAREAGISGIISTNRSPSEIVAAVSAISQGQLSFDPLFAATNSLIHAIHLTPREGHLVELLTQGLKNKEIAYQLGITEGTVKVYLSKLFQKVGAKDRFDLALSGLKNLGLASMESRTDSAAVTPLNSGSLRTLVTRRSPARERRMEDRVLAG
jgi:DNA-binding NarL/FixJ family response regulator